VARQSHGEAITAAGSPCEQRAAQFAAGTNVVTWTATDGSGNTATCQQRVIVRDSLPPTITCPTDVTVNFELRNLLCDCVALGNPRRAITVARHRDEQRAGTVCGRYQRGDLDGDRQQREHRDMPAASDCARYPAANDYLSGGVTVMPMLELFGTEWFWQSNSERQLRRVTVTSNAPGTVPVGTNLVTWTATTAAATVQPVSSE